MSTLGMLGWFALALASVTVACDESEVLHEPDPGLARMLLQRRGFPYAASSVFDDGRLMRSPPPDTVARDRRFPGQLPLETGRDDAGYVRAVPLPVTATLLRRGHAAFDRTCGICHGLLGDGNSVVAEKMTLRRPPSLHEPRIGELPPGKLFEVVSSGYGLMPGYAPVLATDERWAVVAYVGALRLSQAAPVKTLPATMRAELMAEAH
jgi:mono/diheme cytochrome c family protein